MPAKREWLSRLTEMIEELEALQAPVLDRAACERLFGLKRRRTIELLHVFGGYQAGRTFLVDRLVLLERLREIESGEEFGQELRRRQRLNDILENLRRHSRARQVRIPVEEKTKSLPELPAGVTLAPGELRVRFQNAEELLGKLYELAQAAARDFESFQRAVT